jgi:hypothetical protein
MWLLLELVIRCGDGEDDDDADNGLAAVKGWLVVK